MCGFLLWIVTIPVAHFRWPRVPPLVLSEHDDDATLRYFEAQYIETLKARQVKAAWTGLILGVVAALLYMVGDDIYHGHIRLKS